VINRVYWFTLAALVVGLSWQGAIVAQGKGDPVAAAKTKLASKNPDARAEGVEELVRANNRAAAEAVMNALSTEGDGPAGFRMADAVANLNSPEALAHIERTVMGWTAGDKLFGAYWCFCGLARMRSEKADAILNAVVNDSKEREIYIRSAAIEAIAYAGRTDQALLLVDTLSKYEPAWDQRNMILTLTCVQNAPKLCAGVPTEIRDRVVLALAGVLENTKDDRVVYFVATALNEITGEEKYTDAAFWRWWVEAGGKKVERQKGGDGNTVSSRDVPKFFKAGAVGKRVVFVIDVSGSMQHPVRVPRESRNPPPPPPPKKEEGPVTGKGEGKGDKGDKDDKDKPAEIPKPDYSKVKSKLDLAKVELIHCLKYLPEDYKFNVVTYETGHSLLDSSTKALIPATQANKDRMIKKVNALSPMGLTNIHGGLIRSFCISEKGMIDQKKQNPGWDPDCMATGATTIFFLTDGSPTMSDDTTNVGEIGGNGAAVRPNGRMVDSGNIVQDIRRVNTFRKVVINTIGIGPHNGRLMNELARISGGEYIDRSGVADRGD
jgi:hypothetical protein